MIQHPYAGQWRVSSLLGNCCKQVCVLKKSNFLPNRQNWGGYKMLRKLRKSFVGSHQNGSRKSASRPRSTKTVQKMFSASFRLYRRVSLTKSGVAVEKLPFCQNSRNLGHRKCLTKRRSSFVGLPIAKFFRRFSRERVFQQPRLITTII